MASYNFMSSLFNKNHKKSTILPLFDCSDLVKCYDFDFDKPNCLSITKINKRVQPIIESYNSYEVSVNIDSAIYDDTSVYKFPDLNNHVDSRYIGGNAHTYNTNTNINTNNNTNNNTDCICCTMV